MKKMTLSEFICAAHKVHGAQYGYDLVEYVRSGEKVEIVCTKHGSFFQTPNSHLSGRGCNKCASERRAAALTTPFSVVVQKASKVHRNKYTYNNDGYPNKEGILRVICPAHGEFRQLVGNHLAGHGCPRCAAEATSKRCRSSPEDFIAASKSRYGDKYDYSQVVYKNSVTEVTLRCGCGTVFNQKPANHLKANGGCPTCRGRAISSAHTYSFEEFVNRAAAKHGGRYYYYPAGYIASSKKVEIVCPEHGKFSQQGTAHLAGSGCPACYKLLAGRSRFATAKARCLSRLAEVHGDTYDYSLLQYAGRHKKVTIICRKHGEFVQELGSHLSGNGCPECGKALLKSKVAVSFDEFVGRAREVHGEAYDYFRESYTNLTSPCIIVCKKHGEFIQTPKDHVDGHRCKKCVNCGSSTGQEEVADFLSGLGVHTEQNVSNRLDGRLDIDILITSKSLAVEYNGLHWHSERTGRGNTYHQRKSSLAAEAGINLVHVSDLQWRTRRSAVESLLKAKCGVLSERVSARKCTVVPLSAAEARPFLETSHIQGFRGSPEHYGLMHDGRLVSVASFGKSKAGEAELRRFASLPGVLVRGGMGKLVRHWQRNHPGEDLITFCDTSQFSGGAYGSVGFVEEKVLPPDYGYTNGAVYYSKEAFRKQQQQIRFPNYRQDLTEKENAEANGWYRVWGCSKIKFRLPAASFA